MMTTQMNQTVAAGTNSVPVEFINKVEVARRLKKTVRCVDAWMAKGILPYYKIGRSVAFKVERDRSGTGRDLPRAGANSKS